MVSESDTSQDRGRVQSVTLYKFIYDFKKNIYICFLFSNALKFVVRPSFVQPANSPLGRKCPLAAALLRS